MFPNFKGNDWYVFVFTANEFTDELLESSPEGRLEWIDNDKLTSLNLWESDDIFMPWIREGKFFSAKFEYEGEVMQRYDVIFYKTEKSLQEHYGDQFGNNRSDALFVSLI